MSQGSGRERTRPRLRLGRGWPDSTWGPRARVSRAQSRRPGLWFCGSSASPAEPARGAASRSRERTCGAEVATARVGQAEGTGWPTVGPAPVQAGVTEGPGRQNRYLDPAGHRTASQDGGRLLAPPRGVERPGLVHAFKKGRRLPRAGVVGLTPLSLPATRSSRSAPRLVSFSPNYSSRFGGISETAMTARVPSPPSWAASDPGRVILPSRGDPRTGRPESRHAHPCSGGSGRHLWGAARPAPTKSLAGNAPCPGRLPSHAEGESSESILRHRRPQNLHARRRKPDTLRSTNARERQIRGDRKQL